MSSCRRRTRKVRQDRPALLALDGVHPTLGACHLLANAWVEAVIEAGVFTPV